MLIRTFIRSSIEWIFAGQRACDTHTFDEAIGGSSNRGCIDDDDGWDDRRVLIEPARPSDRSSLHRRYEQNRSSAADSDLSEMQQYASPLARSEQRKKATAVGQAPFHFDDQPPHDCGDTMTRTSIDRTFSREMRRAQSARKQSRADMRSTCPRTRSADEHHAFVLRRARERLTANEK
jgi:hypothetical protein